MFVYMYFVQHQRTYAALRIQFHHIIMPLFFRGRYNLCRKFLSGTLNATVQPLSGGD